MTKPTCKQCQAPLGASRFLCEYCGAKTGLAAQSEADEIQLSAETVATVKHILQSDVPASMASSASATARWKEQQGDKIRDIWITAPLPNTPAALERAALDALDSVSAEALASPLLARSQPVLLARARSCADRLARVPGHEATGPRLVEMVDARKAELFPPLYRRRSFWIGLTTVTVLAGGGVGANYYVEARDREAMAAFRQMEEARQAAIVAAKVEKLTAQRTKLIESRLEGEWEFPKVNCAWSGHRPELLQLVGSTDAQCASTLTLREGVGQLTVLYAWKKTHANEEVYKVKLACGSPIVADVNDGVLAWTCAVQDWPTGNYDLVSDARAIKKLPKTELKIFARVPRVLPAGEWEVKLDKIGLPHQGAPREDGLAEDSADVRVQFRVEQGRREPFAKAMITEEFKSELRTCVGFELYGSCLNEERLASEVETAEGRRLGLVSVIELGLNASGRMK